MPAKLFYSPDDVATLLDLNVRTVRRYIREGRLKATRIGKQYRIAGADLSDFVGAEGMPAAVATRLALVSSIVDIDAVDRDAANRIGSLVQAVPLDGSAASGRRVDCLYYEDARKLRIAINGEIAFTKDLLELIETVLKDRASERV